MSRRSRIAPALVAFALLGGAACLVVPRGFEAQSLFAIENDPVQIADREIAASLTPERARQEIEAALTANDADLARSFVELAQERGIVLDAPLVARVNEAVAKAEVQPRRCWKASRRALSPASRKMARGWRAR